MTGRPSLLILSFSPIRSGPRVLKQVELFRDRYRVSTCGYGLGPDGVEEHFALPEDARGWSSDKVGLLTRNYRRVYEGLTAVAAARRVLPPGRFDIVLANDLNTLPLAVDLRPSLGVHADLHEFAPREKDDDLRWRLAVAPFMRWLCRTYLRSAASVTTVSDGIAAAYANDYGVRVGVVTNAAPRVHLSVRPTTDRIRLIHSAAGQRYRKLETFIEVMRDAPEHITLDMIVMPNELDYVRELHQLAEDVPAVRFRDPVPYPELVDTLHEYDVSIVVLPPTNFNLRNALPNKLFEAVQARLGVIVGPSPAMSTLVRQYGFGEVTDDFGPEALRRVLQALTPETVDRWKSAADRASEPLSAQAQMRVWEDDVDAIAASARPQRSGDRDA